MTDQLRQAAQQALDALEELDGLDTETECVTIDVGDVITAIRAALEQQQAEPVSELQKRYLESEKAFQQQAEPVVDCPRCGHVCSQRQWVGLTDEDVNRESAPIAQQMKLAFHAGMYVAQQILKEKNSD